MGGEGGGAGEPLPAHRALVLLLRLRGGLAVEGGHHAGLPLHAARYHTRQCALAPLVLVRVAEVGDGGGVARGVAGGGGVGGAAAGHGHHAHGNRIDGCCVAKVVVSPSARLGGRAHGGVAHAAHVVVVVMGGGGLGRDDKSIGTQRGRAVHVAHVVGGGVEVGMLWRDVGVCGEREAADGHIVVPSGAIVDLQFLFVVFMLWTKLRLRLVLVQMQMLMLLLLLLMVLLPGIPEHDLMLIIVIHWGVVWDGAGGGLWARAGKKVG